MRKRVVSGWLGGLMLVLCSAGMSPAMAQEDVTFSLGGQGIYWNVSDLDDCDGEGLWGGGVVAQLQFCEYLALDGRISFMGATASTYWSDGWYRYRTDADLFVMPIELGLTLLLPVGDVVSLYGGPGVGFYFFDASVSNSDHHHRDWYYWEDYDHVRMDDNFGFYALGGLKIALADQVGLFVEGKYTWVETSFKDLGEEWGDVDIQLDGFSIGIGALFTF